MTSRGTSPIHSSPTHQTHNSSSPKTNIIKQAIQSLLNDHKSDERIGPKPVKKPMEDIFQFLWPKSNLPHGGVVLREGNQFKRNKTKSPDTTLQNQRLKEPLTEEQQQQQKVNSEEEDSDDARFIPTFPPPHYSIRNPEESTSTQPNPLMNPQTFDEFTTRLLLNSINSS